MRRINSYVYNIYTHYAKPVRATAERGYTWDELPIKGVDPNGENLAMVLSHLPKSLLEQFNLWIEEHFGFRVHIKRAGHVVSILIQEKGAPRPHNLADTGFGYSQILPLLTQLWLIISDAVKDSHDLVYAIEQPELHLHPQLQAMLADGFAAVIRTAREQGVNLCLLIETHSRVIVNRLGHHVYFRQEPDVDDIAVYLFDKPDASSPTTIQTSGFNEKGMLKDWPIGFFEPELLN